jgi:hypothetical protein
MAGRRTFRLLTSSQPSGTYVYISGNNETYLGVHVKRLIFSSDFNQIWTFSIDILKSFQYQVLSISL